MPANLDSFCTNPEILGKKCAKSGRVGEWGAGGWAICVATALRFAFYRRMQALSKGLWIICAEMHVALHILGMGEVSDCTSLFCQDRAVLLAFYCPS